MGVVHVLGLERGIGFFLECMFEIESHPLPPSKTHIDNRKSTIFEDVFPVENCDFSMSC